MIYYIQGEISKKIKIGYSRHPEHRMSQLQTGSPDQLKLLAVSLGDLGHEKELHIKFSSFRSHGEWFNDDESIYEFIRVYGHNDPVELAVYENKYRSSGCPIEAFTPLHINEIKKAKKEMLEDASNAFGHINM